MSGTWMPGEDDAAERPTIGRPRPEPAQLMTARQLVYAYVEARNADDRRYAIEEAETFLDAVGDSIENVALVALLGLPPDDQTRGMLADVAARLNSRMPAALRLLLRAALEGEEPACDNAAATLERLPVADLAEALAGALREEGGARLKRAAAAELVALGQPAASQILDALGDPELRDWITEAAGCPLDASDAQVMTMIVCGRRRGWG
jgi:hypothetical protein